MLSCGADCTALRTALYLHPMLGWAVQLCVRRPPHPSQPLVAPDSPAANFSTQPLHRTHASIRLYTHPRDHTAAGALYPYCCLSPVQCCLLFVLQVYGIAWNPLRPSDGRRGSEFVSYGVKHLKSWVVNDQVGPACRFCRSHA